ncbi:LysM peptidoglycan-binding domain-containing protein [Pseudarthrobacter scleromae]|uniref:LysM peptidoglycan-binding domain-containing protein n=1 Tax=Pseudarthrobacter scleromae TaxID=158897 RepID=UPI003D029653
MSASSVSRGSRPQLLSVQQLLSGPEERKPERPAPLPPLRLTRRGRIVLIGIPLVLLAALLLSLAGFFNSPAKASDSAADLETTSAVSVTVQPGQSLWGIAATVAPERDARDVVADIVQLNNLSAGTVFPGQQLFVPAG